MKSLYGETEPRTTDAGIMSKQAAHKVEAAQLGGGTRQPTEVQEEFVSYIFTINKVK